MFAAGLCDLVTFMYWISAHFTLCVLRYQDETQWGQTTTIPVVPLEHPCSYLPLTTGRLSHQNDIRFTSGREIACKGFNFADY